MMHAKAAPAAPIVAQVELAPGLQVKATIAPARGEDLRPAICVLLGQGPKTTAELQAALRVSVSRLHYYLAPLALRLGLAVCNPAARRNQPNRWSLAVPLSQALAALAQEDRAAQLAQHQAQGRAHLQAQAQERLQAKQDTRAARAPAPAPQEPQPQPQPALGANSAPRPTQAPQADPDRKRPLLTSATLDPRREPPLTLPGAPPLSPVAARAAAERLAKRATVHGLTWTYRPVHGLRGIWEIVESQRQEDHRLAGEDVCERRLHRWAREGFCPPRIDTSKTANLQRQEVTP